MQKNCTMAALFLVEHKAASCEECALNVRISPEDGSEAIERCFFNCNFDNCPCREVPTLAMIDIDRQIKNANQSSENNITKEIIETEAENIEK